jgi:hypothetical protein
MTLAFLELRAAERKVYIDEAAARRGLAPVIVEKDFWVCWLLGILFQSSFRDAIVFKGGSAEVADATIDIPRVLVVPIGKVESGFSPFTLDLSSVHYQPVTEDLWIQHLRTAEYQVLSTGAG